MVTENKTNNDMSWMALFPLLLSALVMWKFYHPLGITADGHTYLQIARNIQSGAGLGWQALWATPLPPIIIAGVDSIFGVHNLVRTAGLIAPVMGVLLTASVYFLASGLFDRKTAIIASLVAAVTPHFLWITFSTEPEIYYTVFLVIALGLLDRAVSRNSLLLGAGAGCAFCCAYLSRSEGFLIMVITSMALLVGHGKQTFHMYLPRVIAIMLVAFFIAASPYLLFLHKHYGAFVISPKATYVLIWMKGYVYRDHDKVEQEDDDLWGLTPDGRLKWQVPSGVGDLVRYLMQDPGKSGRVYVNNLLMELPGRVPNNSGALHYPNVFPVYLALLAAFALFVPWGESSKRKKIIISAPFLILLILPVFTGGWWKYLVPYAPLLTILAAAGLVFGADRLFPGSRRTGTVVVALVTIVIMTYYVDRYSGGLFQKPVPQKASAKASLAEDARKAGQWAAAHYGAGKNYMVAWIKIIYYLNGLWTALPVAWPEEVYLYALRNKVDVLVLEVPPALSDEALSGAVPGFLLDSIYHSETSPYRVAFFRPIR
jgi:4-amino-4-deoxy-L-arabinose transferase-like glycosyltransferase